ncbi:hypothetical protein J6590_076761 [Homalodisca vitripennis]|nr:hypothetical protein J6590_076761 [Homalodisca vitripennis]
MGDLRNIRMTPNRASLATFMDYDKRDVRPPVSLYDKPLCESDGDLETRSIPGPKNNLIGVRKRSNRSKSERDS